MTTNSAAKKTAPSTKTAAPAAKKPAAPRRRSAPKLRGEAIRARLASDQTPVVFVGPTPYNLLGLDRWVGGLRYVSRHDPFDGAHPRLLTPARHIDTELITGADVVNHLLGDPEVQDHLAELEAVSGSKPKITAVYVDAETERLCAELGYQLIAPMAADRERIAAAVEWIDSAESGRLVTVPAVVTRRGTVVGSVATSLFGDPALTLDPYAWSGAGTSPQLLSHSQRAQASDLVSGLGDQLAKTGFRGYFEAQLSVDDLTGEIQLVGAAPGIGAATALTTAAPGAYADLPLYALHVLEHLGIDLDLDVAELNRRAVDLAVLDAQSQLLIAETVADLELLVDAPASGRYVLDELGTAHLVERSLDWHGLSEPGEFYFLRLAGPGDQRWLGSDLGVVITRGRARTMINSVRWSFVGVPAQLAYA